MSTQRIGALVFVVLGLGLLVAGAGVAASRAAFVSRSREVTAVVVDVTGGPGPSGGWQERAELEWTPEGGTKRTTQVFASESGSFSVGQQLSYRYEPAEPASTLRPGDTLSLWFLPFTLLALGGPFAFVGLRALRRLRA